MLFDNCINSKEQGNIGIGSAINYFLKNRYTISLPINDSQDYDLIVDKDGILYKVQVKTTKNHGNNNCFIVNLRVNGGNSKINYTHKVGTEIVYDLLYILCDNGDTYLIPKENINTVKSSINVGNKKYSEYKII